VPPDTDIEAFESALRADWARRGWDPSGSWLLLCVSGGADSIALLRAFHRLGPRLGCRLSAVHVDHRLRPESEADAAFVARACADLAVPLSAYVLAPSTRAPGESVEMWARRERYARFGAALAAAEASGRTAWILTAHHRDDLVETFFQRLGRGTGPRGLAAIPFRRGNIVRPFLDRPREEVRAYAAALGAAWREDASNADVTLDRNWYRHRYLPALRAREAGLDARVAAAAAAMASLRHAFDELESREGLLRFDPEGKPYLGTDGLSERIAEGDRESLRHGLQALVRAAIPAGSPAPTVTPAILREFLRQWAQGSGAVRVQVAPGLALVREKRGISGLRAAFLNEIGRGPAKKSCSPEAQRVILESGAASAVWRWGGCRYSLTARRFPRPAGLDFPPPSEDRAIFDADRISCTLLVRIRKDGDRFSPLGMQSRSRKLKTFFNEEKVPAGLRDSLPIVVSCHPQERAGTTADGESDALTGEVPAWIPGYGMSDFYKVRGSTTHILELVMKCENP
jgi:tRNA(Ile)-lysidine synthetase-like protein